MKKIQGTPFAPGMAGGRVTDNVADANADQILLITQAQLSAAGGQPAGVIVVDGAPFSHAMIRLLSWGVPIVIVNQQMSTTLHIGRFLVINGADGTLQFDHATPATMLSPPSPPQAGMPVLTADGQEVWLRASVANATASSRAVALGAGAIGLVRSEFIQPADGTPPDAAFYAKTLTQICEAARPLPVTIRLLDVAADKQPPWLKPYSGMNSPLGLQGARLFHLPQMKQVLNAELDAIETLSHTYHLSLLIPYIARLQEFERWRDAIDAKLSTPIAIGTMAETPAAALTINDLLRSADFVALGCNDLMQCLFAADRDIAEVADLLDAYAPVLFHLLQHVADRADDKVNAVQVCGLLPQLPGVLPIMLGLGYRAFSVDPTLIPYLAETVTQTNSTDAADLAIAVLRETNSDNVRRMLGLAVSNGT